MWCVRPYLYMYMGVFRRACRCVWGAGVSCVVDVVSMKVWFIYPTSGVKNRKNSFRILSARFILVKGEGKIRDARGSEIH